MFFPYCALNRGDYNISRSPNLLCVGKAYGRIIKTSRIRPDTRNNLQIIMNKAGIVEVVQGVLGGTKVQAEQVVDTVFDTIVNTLKKGEEVSVAGIGIFSVKQRAARQARNPRTGESISVKAMKVPKFRAAKALKDAVK